MADLKRSAGLVVVHKLGGEIRFLVLRAYRNWDFPKGLVDLGEDCLAAAVRETAEETSLRELRFTWGYGYSETQPYANNKVARFYLAEAAEASVHLAINPQLGRPEHHEYRWVSYAQGKALLSARLHPILDWAQARMGLPPGTPDNT